MHYKCMIVLLGHGSCQYNTLLVSIPVLPSHTPHVLLLVQRAIGKLTEQLNSIARSSALGDLE
jgi:hypothetical protein